MRGMDDLIATAGRSMLAKILKGSKDKKLLQHALDKSPVYGFYKQYKLEDIAARIDWVIVQRYLSIEYNFRLPVLIYTAKGWGIERDSYSDELLAELRSLVSGEAGFIPILEAWQKNDYRKVKKAIAKVIRALEQTDKNR